MSEETGATTNKPTLKLKLSSQVQSAEKIRQKTIKTEEAATAYTAQPLSVREIRIENAAEQANNLNNLLDGIAQSSNVIDDAKDRLAQVQGVIEQARGLAKQSLSGDNVSDSTIEQLNALLSEISTIAQSGSFETNLLTGDTLETQLRHTSSSSTMETAGLEISAEALGISTNITDINQTTYTQLSDAIQMLYSFSAGLNSASSQIKDQLNFTKETIQTITQNSELNTEKQAEQTEEAANLLALQTRQLLSSNKDIPLASASQQNILRLF